MVLAGMDHPAIMRVRPRQHQQLRRPRGTIHACSQRASLDPFGRDLAQ